MPRPSLPRTLSELFAPPDDSLVGVRGVLCGYSADPDFLERAMHRFTRVSAASRAARGDLEWTLLLDPRHQVHPAGTIAGIWQLRPEDPARCRWKADCMHAKVALLGFAKARVASPERYRLVVSTGNWTLESAREQIEMAWFLDVGVMDAAAEDRRDLWSGARFLEILLSNYQGADSLLLHPCRSFLHAAQAAGLKPGWGEATRFFSTLPLDNLDGKPRAVLQEIESRFAARISGANRLVCGSGSYEQATADAEEAQVLKRLVDRLQENDILARSAERRIVVNPDGRDQVANLAAAGKLPGWDAFTPKDTAKKKRGETDEEVEGRQARSRLHAKFLFVGKERAGALSRACLYMGSGNLSWKGFLLPPGEQRGNIEAGVVLVGDEDDVSCKGLESALPIGRPLDPRALREGEPEEEPPPTESVFPCPVLAFTFSGGSGLSILWDANLRARTDVKWVHPAGEVHSLSPGQETLESVFAEPPRMLEVRWTGHLALVPCLLPEGRFRRQAYVPPTFHDWLDQLWGFPESWADPASDEVAIDPGDGENLPEPAGNGGPSRAAYIELASRAFPAHTAMRLVEAIADRNGEIEEARAGDWLAFLRHHLLDLTPPERVQEWKSLGVNFLRALASRRGFAPEWEDVSGYLALIRDVEKAWNLEGAVLELEG